MEHFVTLIDSLFLPQAVALHASLRRHAPESVLWVLCMDDAAREVLSRMALPGLRTLALAGLESPGLLEAKKDRSRAEYCWTLTPCTPRFVFEADPSVTRVTYVDADLWFLRSPQVLVSELESAGRSVLLTEHAYPPGKDQSATSGRFCVQFMSFVRGESEPVRAWWEERCIEWCYARVEPGRFGDQKYLDDWPERFPAQVHVLTDPALALAPWNLPCFPVDRAVFYHFHGLRLLRRDRVALASRYPVGPEARARIYEPYLRELSAAVQALAATGWNAPAQDPKPAWRFALRNWAEGLRFGWEPRMQSNIATLPGSGSSGRRSR